MHHCDTHGEHDGQGNCINTINVPGERPQWTLPGYGFLLPDLNLGGLGVMPNFSQVIESVIVVTAGRSQSVARRIYRWLNPDPCKGWGGDEGGGVPAGCDPYNVNELASMERGYDHILVEHGKGHPQDVANFRKNIQIQDI